MKSTIACMLILWTIILYIPAHSQSVAGLSAISGVVKDSTGATVAGAKVTVTNDSNGIERLLTTTDAGIFTAASLVPTTGYHLTVTRDGFDPFEITNIQVMVGQNLNIDVKLLVAGAKTEIEVTAEVPLVDSLKTDVSQVVDSTQLLNLPINGRRVDSFVLLSPAVVPDGQFGLVSFRGIAGGNAFLTDGNDTTNQFYNENAGRTRISSQISQDAVQEFQVISNNFSAEFGRATGGVVNTVTRSGGNQIHGTGYWFFRNQDFNAKDTFATINPQETRNQFGASVGGPVSQDRIFYFLNYEGTRRDFPLISSLTAPGNPLFNPAGQFIATCTASAVQCQTARSFLDRHFQTVPRTATQDLGFAKLDYRPNEKHSFSASMNILRWVSPNGLQTQAVLNNGNGIGNNVNSSVRTKYGRATWTAIATPAMVNEFRFGWFNDKLFDYPNDKLAIPGVGFVGISIPGQTNLGTATDYPRVNPRENRFQWSDTLSWTIAKNSLKFGFDIARTQDYTNLLFNRTGTYLFPSYSALALDLSGNTSGAKNWSTYTQTIGNPVVDFTVTDSSFFVQDQYTVNSRLTLNVGVRYDYSGIPQPTVTNPDYPASGKIPTYGKSFGPRFGFAYTIGQEAKTVIRGGYGIFYARYPGGLINTLFLGNGIYQKSITLNSGNASDLAGGPVFPNRLPDTGSYNPPVGSVSLNIAAKDFRAPYTDQGNLAIEHELTRDLGLTVSYLWSRGAHLTSVNDINIGAPGPTVTYRINDASGNQTGSYSTPVYVRQNRVDTRYARINIVDSGLNSYYNGLAVQLNKRVSRGVSGSVAYTWSHAIDYGQGGAGTSNIFASGGPQTYVPGDYKGEKGTSALDVRHRLVVNAVLAPTFVHSDNATARYLVNNWELSILGTFSSAPPTTPVVQIASAPTPAPFTAANTGTLNGYTSAGLGNRVPFLPIASLDIDKVSKIDLRLTKFFPITDRIKAQFSVDAFNVLNHRFFTSVATRAFVASVVNGVPTLTPAAGYGLGTASQGFPDGTNARRLQIGVRLMF